MSASEHLGRNRTLLARLLGPQEPEVSCEECFEQLDRYADLELAGGDADSAIPGLRAHLEGCPACREDYESLTWSPRGSRGSSSTFSPTPDTTTSRCVTSD